MMTDRKKENSVHRMMMGIGEEKILAGASGTYL